MSLCVFGARCVGFVPDIEFGECTPVFQITSRNKCPIKITRLSTSQILHKCPKRRQNIKGTMMLCMLLAYLLSLQTACEDFGFDSAFFAVPF